MRLQLTFDCVDPHALAAFYVDADIGYQVEDHTEGVDQLLSAGLIAADDVVEVGGRRGLASAAACSDADGRLPRLHFQRVPEPKQTKNRLHFDLQFFRDGDARDAAVARLIGVGARRVGEGSQGPHHAWVVLADPEGNEFCVSN